MLIVCDPSKSKKVPGMEKEMVLCSDSKEVWNLTTFPVDSVMTCLSAHSRTGGTPNHSSAALFRFNTELPRGFADANQDNYLSTKSDN